MPLKIKKTVDLNLVVHQFVKTTKANYRTMLKVSQNGNTIQHLSFLPSKKEQKHIMVDMRSTNTYLFVSKIFTVDSVKSQPNI